MLLIVCSEIKISSLSLLCNQKIKDMKDLRKEVKSIKMFIVYYIDSCGNKTIEGITDDLDKWIVSHNSCREYPESLDEFHIVEKIGQMFN